VSPLEEAHRAALAAAAAAEAERDRVAGRLTSVEALAQDASDAYEEANTAYETTFGAIATGDAPASALEPARTAHELAARALREAEVGARAVEVRVAQAERELAQAEHDAAVAGIALAKELCEQQKQQTLRLAAALGKSHARWHRLARTANVLDAKRETARQALAGREDPYAVGGEPVPFSGWAHQLLGRPDEGEGIAAALAREGITLEMGAVPGMLSAYGEGGLSADDSASVSDAEFEPVPIAALPAHPDPDPDFEDLPIDDDDFSGDAAMQ